MIIHCNRFNSTYSQYWGVITVEVVAASTYTHTVNCLQHLHMCLNLVKLFKGREEIIDSVTSYLKGRQITNSFKII